MPASTQIAKATRSEEHTSELQSRLHLVCRLLLEKKTFSVFASLFAFSQNSPSPAASDTTPQNRGLRATLQGQVLYPYARPFSNARLFFLNEPATTEIYTLSLHDALPI